MKMILFQQVMFVLLGYLTNDVFVEDYKSIPYVAIKSLTFDPVFLSFLMIPVISGSSKFFKTDIWQTFIKYLPYLWIANVCAVLIGVWHVPYYVLMSSLAFALLIIWFTQKIINDNFRQDTV